MNLRRSILARDDARPAQAHITLAHPRNAQAAGNTPENAAGLHAQTISFRVVALIEQRDRGPWSTLATWPLSNATGDFAILGLPAPAAGLTPTWFTAENAATLQRFYDANPHYFLMVEGTPAAPDAAWEDIAGPLPPGWPYCPSRPER